MEYARKGHVREIEQRCLSLHSHLLGESEQGQLHLHLSGGAELDLFIAPYVYMDADAAYDVYDRRLNSGNIGFNLTDQRKDTLYFEYRYTRDQVESIKGDLLVNLTRTVAGGIEYEKNIRDDRRLLAGARVIYRSQCWAIGARYLDQFSDRKIEFWVEFTGLGELKGSL